MKSSSAQGRQGPLPFPMKLWRPRGVAVYMKLLGDGCEAQNPEAASGEFALFGFSVPELPETHQAFESVKAISVAKWLE